MCASLVAVVGGPAEGTEATRLSRGASLCVLTVDLKAKRRAP